MKATHMTFPMIYRPTSPILSIYFFPTCEIDTRKSVNAFCIITFRWL